MDIGRSVGRKLFTGFYITKMIIMQCSFIMRVFLM